MIYKLFAALLISLSLADSRRASTSVRIHVTVTPQVSIDNSGNVTPMPVVSPIVYNKSNITSKTCDSECVEIIFQ